MSSDKSELSRMLDRDTVRIMVNRGEMDVRRKRWLGWWRLSPCPPLLSSSDIVVIVRVMCSRWNAKTITKGIVSFADVLHDVVRFYLLYSWRVSYLAISKVRESDMVKGFPVFCRTSAGSKSKIGKVYHGRARSGTLVHGIWINGGRGPCGSRIRARPCRRVCPWTRSRRR